MNKLSLLVLCLTLSIGQCVLADDASRQAQIAQAQARANQNIQSIQQKQLADKQLFDQTLQAINTNPQNIAPVKPGNKVIGNRTPGIAPVDPNLPQREIFTPQTSPSNDITGLSGSKPNTPEKKSSSWEYGF